MRGGWVAGLIELCVYLFGFVVTGRIVASREPVRNGEDLLGLIGLAFFWPLVAVVGLLWCLAQALGWLFGVWR